MAVDFDRDILPPSRRAALVLSIKAAVRRGMASGMLPQADGYFITMKAPTYDVLDLTVELTDKGHNVIAGPFSFMSLRLKRHDWLHTDEINVEDLRFGATIEKQMKLAKASLSYCCEAPTYSNKPGRYGPRYCSSCGNYLYDLHFK